MRLPYLGFPAFVIHTFLIHAMAMPCYSQTDNPVDISHRMTLAHTPAAADLLTDADSCTIAVLPVRINN